MYCLECTLSPAIDEPLTAIADCAYCGAGVCINHARVINIRTEPIGVVPQVRVGVRRILCTTDYASGPLEGEKAGTLTAATPGVDAATEEARAPAGVRAGR